MKLNNMSIRNMWMNIWKDKILQDSETYSGREKRGHDQKVLSNNVWSVMKNMTLHHDSYT